MMKVLELVNGRLRRIKDKSKAILLYGSFARGEIDELSDIDVMVILREPSDLEYVKEQLKDFNAVITTEEGVKETLKFHPSIAIMLKEAIVLHGKPPEIPELNKEDMLRELDEALKIMDVNESLLFDIDEETVSAVIYSTILRARQAYIIRCLLRNEKMTKKGFIEELRKLGIREVYYNYFRLARDDKLKILIDEKELERVVKIVRNYIKEVRNEVEENL
ncbi:MAG: hypothetical protein DRO98_06780 [Archaeoglobales archaeon]|nr:MAG: hypothetical protein DRO98_06780 [Archaeoglobales archaeon]